MKNVVTILVWKIKKYRDWMHEKKVTSDLGGGGSESRLIAKINHLQQIFTRQVEAAHLFYLHFAYPGGIYILW